MQNQARNKIKYGPNEVEIWFHQLLIRRDIICKCILSSQISICYNVYATATASATKRVHLIYFVVLILFWTENSFCFCFYFYNLTTKVIIQFHQFAPFLTELSFLTFEPIMYLRIQTSNENFVFSHGTTKLKH